MSKHCACECGCGEQKNHQHRDWWGIIFNEITLMIVAAAGACAIGEWLEGCAVIALYLVGEGLQGRAVKRVRGNIKALLDVRPVSVTTWRSDSYESVEPEKVEIGERIRILVGERVALDGRLLSAAGSFNTSALTGESTPRTIHRGETVLAGMIPTDCVVEIEVEKRYADSSLARILEMVEKASQRKARSELLIRRFARIYTPVVFALALILVFLPALFLTSYNFSEWLYRGLVFLVISCPCALVISIPLSYFAGIGAASRHGVLFKGANFLDRTAKISTLVMDKTGTLTRGVFRVQQVVGDVKKSPLYYASALEQYSTHPIARAIVEYAPPTTQATDVEEVAGFGMRGRVDDHEVVVGKAKMLKNYPPEIDAIVETTVVIGVDNQYVGHIIIADEIKPDAPNALAELHRLGIKHTIILSGDRTSITSKIAHELGVSESYGDLLPEQKLTLLEQIKGTTNPLTRRSDTVAFVGDGINDAPALALADVGFAMGAMGSDAAIEVADVVFQSDEPSSIATAIRIARNTQNIVVQNITLALTVKFAVLTLGALGFASMWAAVFADVGVSLLAIANALRLLHK